MSHSAVLSETQTIGPDQPGMNPGDAVRCALPVKLQGPGTLASDPGRVLEEAGCPLASGVQERLGFEALLADLSATFINLTPNQVDSQIESALERLVVFLGFDRGGLAEFLVDQKQLVITHSYHMPGVPLLPRIIVNEQLPWYAKTIYQGEVLRLCELPDDLPPEATFEREYCLQVGLKSHLMIPLKVMGAVVGSIGFDSFRRCRDWPDDLIQRLRLVGDIFTNALARKRADEALKLALEQAHVLHEELAHATRLELVSHLTTSIAHELNQPLCAIASNAQTAIDLLNRGEKEELKQTLQDIWGDARRGSEVIGRIRKMVKKEESCRIPTNLALVIEEIAPLLRREAVARGVVLRIDLDAKDLTVVCDRVQLQQVVLNLVLNAVEAVSTASVGPPEVQIRAEWENPDWAHVCVEDSGVGLTAEDGEHLFAPFFTTKAKGLGMGLPISRSIIVAHGGTIWATRGAEHGSTFHFRLPAKWENRP
jgi:signal transduction histidine kinase